MLSSNIVTIMYSFLYLTYLWLYLWLTSDRLFRPLKFVLQLDSNLSVKPYQTEIIWYLAQVVLIDHVQTYK